VARHQGAVVKTIGDAVMAVFAEPDKAMAAATQMIDNVRQAVAHGEDLVLKIGMHSGPCVAIQSNNQLDYFGSTVNIAARVQNLANGGEIVCSEDVWRSAGVQDRVRERGLSAVRETAHLKGIGDKYPVRRVVVAASLGQRPVQAQAQRAGNGAPAVKSAPERAKVAPARTKAKAKVKAAPAKIKAKVKPAPAKASIKAKVKTKVKAAPARHRVGAAGGKARAAPARSRRAAPAGRRSRA
jgi:hypothetical protein